MMFEKVVSLPATALDEICRFYQDICEHQDQDAYSPDWHWGVYPSREVLAEKLQQGKFLAGYQNGQIAAAGVLTVGEDPDYRGVPFVHVVPDDQIGVLHIFAVHPNFRGHGTALTMMQAILDQARADGLAVVHLDVMPSNVPAEKLYRRSGYTLAADVTLHYTDIGDTPARIYECKL